MAKLPGFMFYPGDWMKDPNLRRCSHAAKGVWIDMLCLMFECEQRGVLASGTVPWSDEEICCAVGGAQDVTLSAVKELLAKGVACRSESGAVMSRRMVRDEQIRSERAKSGAKGGKQTQSKLQANSQAKSKQTTESEYENEIESIYSLYPRKVGKKAALKAIRAALVSVRERGKNAEWLKKRVKAFADSPAGQAGEYTPHPATWFNRGSYDDDDAAWQRGGKPKPFPNELQEGLDLRD